MSGKKTGGGTSTTAGPPDTIPIAASDFKTFRYRLPARHHPFAARVGPAFQKGVAGCVMGDRDRVQAAVEVAHAHLMAARGKKGGQRLGIGAGLKVGRAIAVDDVGQGNRLGRAELPVEHAEDGLRHIADDP